MDNSREKIWDPLRRKMVALTPEERVRQWFIGILSRKMEVPMHMMMSEVSLSFGGKPWRADIVVYDRAVRPLIVVECKQPEVKLDQEVLTQVIRYNMVLDVKCIIITNGTSTVIAVKDSQGAFAFVSEPPTFKQLIEQ